MSGRGDKTSIVIASGGRGETVLFVSGAGAADDVEGLVDPVGSVAVSSDVAFAAYLTIIDGTSQDPVFVMPD